MNFTTVKTSDNYIYVRGIKRDKILDDIRKYLLDRRFINNVFEPITFGLKFHEFFLPDVVYLLIQIRKVSRSPAYRYTLNSLIDDLKEKTWLKDIDKDDGTRLDFSMISNMVYKPLDYQYAFLEYYSKRIPNLKLNGALIAAAAGSGKTFLSLTTAECLKSDYVFVICPLPALTKVWENAMSALFKIPQSYWTPKSNKPYNNQKYILCHFEGLSKILEVAELVDKSKKITVILDESHNLNELKAARTQLFIRLVKELKTKDILFLSGTAFKAKINESVPLLTCIDPLFDERASATFTKAFSGEKNKNYELMQSRLGNISFKVEKGEVMVDKPNMIELKVKIPDSDRFTLPEISKVMTIFIAERNKYYESREKDDFAFYESCLTIYENSIKSRDDRIAFNNYKGWIEDIKKAYKRRELKLVPKEIENSNKFENSKIIPSLPQEQKARFKEVKTLVKYRGLKIQGECLGRVLGRFRIDCHVAMVSGIDIETIVNEAQKKTVIFTSYTEVCTEVVRILESKGFSPLAVYGDFTKNLANIVTRFENDLNANPLAATYASLSTAVPLTVANTMIMINSPFRAYIEEQAIARIHRLGADTAVFVYRAVLDTGEVPNISSRGVDILKWSADEVAKITGIENIYQNNTTVIEGDYLTISNESLDMKEEIKLIEINKPLLSNW